MQKDMDDQLGTVAPVVPNPVVPNGTPDVFAPNVYRSELFGPIAFPETLSESAAMQLAETIGSGHSGRSLAGGKAYDPVLMAATARVRELTQKAVSPNTARAYRQAWAAYVDWCLLYGIEPLSGDPKSIALWIGSMADKYSYATIDLRLAAVSVAHQIAGVPLNRRHPILWQTMKGLRREKSLEKKRQARPVRAEWLQVFGDGLAPRPGTAKSGGDIQTENPDPAMGAPGQPEKVHVRGGPAYPIGSTEPAAIRNIAILLTGFATALRRSNIVALDIEDIAILPEGMTVRVRSSKTDQEGKGSQLAVYRATNGLPCPVEAMRLWLETRSSASGPLFTRILKNGAVTQKRLDAQSVSAIIKAGAFAAGLDPSGFSAHSLRAGYITSALSAGTTLSDAMRQSQHKSFAKAMDYDREADAWRRNATKRLFQGESTETKKE